MKYAKLIRCTLTGQSDEVIRWYENCAKHDAEICVEYTYRHRQKIQDNVEDWYIKVEMVLHCEERRSRRQKHAG